MQSVNPLNYLYAASFPTSTPNLVLAKSNGYTNIIEILPAKPPAARFPKKNLSFCVFGLTPYTKFLAKASLTEKLIACVGKYLITLAKLPLQNASKPSSLATLTKQFTILVYCFPLSFVFAA